MSEIEGGVLNSKEESIEQIDQHCDKVSEERDIVQVTQDNNVTGNSKSFVQEEMKTLSEDRHSKDSAIQQLKMWEDKRIDFLTVHKNIIDGIFMRIEKRMKISQDSMMQIVKFFKERKDQEQSYSKVFATKVPHIGHCWRDIGEQQSDWYPLLSQALKETDEVNDSQSKNVQTLVVYLEKNIIKDLLHHENEEFEKRIKTLRNNISDQYQKLDKVSLIATKRNNSYTQLYTTMMGLNTGSVKLKKKRKDLLHVEIKFRQSAFDQIKEEKELGDLMLHYWEEARKMECQRLEMIQRVFQLYLTKHQDTYGKHPAMEATLLNFNQFDSLKETGENFSISKILNDEEQSAIKKTLSISAGLTWVDLNKYLVNFNFKDISISQHPLVQKKFKIMRDVGSLTKSFRECWMVASVDDILLFYDEIDSKNKENKSVIALADKNDKINNEPKKKFILDYIKVKQRDDPTFIDIIEKMPGLIFASTNKQLIKFFKEDDFEEFRVFLIRYQTTIKGETGGIQQVQECIANDK